MSKKNLLNESTIRKFMKLASIEPLASDFISKIQEAEEDVEEGMRMKKADDETMREADEDLEEGRDKDDMDEAKEEDMDEAMHDEEMDEDVDLEERGDMMYKDDEDMDMDMDMGGDDKMLNMNDFLDILEKAVEEFLGEPTDIERDEEGGDEMEMDMDMEEPEGDMEMDMEMGDEEEEEEELEEAKEEDLAEAIYREVLKRISKKK